MVLSGKFQKTRLDNGLRILSEHVPYVRSISLGVWVQVGTRDERTFEGGLSHFVEHAVFKGTHGRDAFDIAYSLESLGGSLDAFTCRDLTCYYARFLDEHLDVALDVLADLVLHPRFDPEEIEKEKRVVLEEIQNVDDTPEDLIHDLFAESVWGAHPVGAPILGTPATVRSFSPEMIRSYWQRHYRPHRIVIAAAGNLEHGALVEKVGALFADSEANGEPLVRQQPEKTPSATRHYRRDIGQTHICIGTTAFAYVHPHRYDLLVANAVLGEGMSSRLFQRIRERLGLAYAVFSYLELLEDTGLFGTYVACDGASARRSIDILQKELERLKREGISPEELESARAQLRGELILGFESMDRRMGRLAREEIYTGTCDPPQATLDAIAGVTRAGVLEACREMLAEDRMHVVTVGP